MKNIVILLVVVFLGGCTCQPNTVINVEKSLTDEMLHKVTKVEYEYHSPSFRPDLTYKEVISLTNTTIEKKIYKGYEDILQSQGTLGVKADTLKHVKLLIVQNSLSKCSKTELDCFGNKQPIELQTGCATQVLNLYVDDKEIFSEYISCNQGKLCGNYTQVFSRLNTLSETIQMKEVDYSPIKIETIE